MIIAYPPNQPQFTVGQPSVFLAGSIEMGLATDWQARICTALVEKDILVLNPRRKDWDSSWEQTSDHDQFNQQVNWELDMLEQADKVIVYFEHSTKAPVSMLELGMFASSGKLVVCCPDGFWRKGNVEIVCTRHSIPMYHTFAALLEHVSKW